MTTQPSFEQRIADLRTAAHVVLDEVARMEAAHTKYAEKQAQRKTASR